MAAVGSSGNGKGGGQDAVRLAVRADYRTGTLSNRAIARKHGVSEITVRRWVADLKAGETQGVVKSRVEELLGDGPEALPVPEPVAPAKPQGLVLVVDNEGGGSHVAEPVARASSSASGVAGDVAPPEGLPLDPEAEARRAAIRARALELLRGADDIVAAELAARAITVVVREHRTELIELRGTITKQQTMLDIVASEALEAWVKANDLHEDETAEEFNRRRSIALAAMTETLVAQAKALAQVSQAMQRAQSMERMAFGLTDFANPEPPKPPPVVEKPTDAHFDKLREKFRERLAAPPPAGEAA